MKDGEDHIRLRSTKQISENEERQAKNGLVGQACILRFVSSCSACRTRQRLQYGCYDHSVTYNLSFLCGEGCIPLHTSMWGEAPIHHLFSTF